jgi:hypothetical protein
MSIDLAENSYRRVGSGVLGCAIRKKQDDWEFHVSGKSMTGTLTVGPEKTLYCRITVRRK